MQLSGGSEARPIRSIRRIERSAISNRDKRIRSLSNAIKIGVWTKALVCPVLSVRRHEDASGVTHSRELASTEDQSAQIVPGGNRHRLPGNSIAGGEGRAGIARGHIDSVSKADRFEGHGRVDRADGPIDAIG